MKKAIVFTVFVLFSLSDPGTLIGADWSDGTEGAIYYNGGNVGIGTTTPLKALDIRSLDGDDYQLILSDYTGNEHVKLGYSNDQNKFGIKFYAGTTPREHEFNINYDEPKFTFTGGSVWVTEENSGDIVRIVARNIETDNPDSHAMIYARTEMGGGDPIFLLGLQGEVNWFISGDRSDDNKLKIGKTMRATIDSGSTYMTIVKNSGYIGIGTANPRSKLAVNGTITAKEVVVSIEGWSDYVLKDDYKLMPLDELERSIEKNGHLPDIPSAEEVKKKGVSVGEMQAKLLKKVEELTLYMIDLKKENEILKKQVASLQNAQ